MSLRDPDLPGGEVVGVRAGAPVTRAEFRRIVARWRNTLAPLSGKAWALYFEDSLSFSCAMLGAWQAGKHVLLPGEVQPGTMEWLAPLADGLIGELPGDSVLRAPDDSARPAAAVHPEAEALAAVVFTSGTTGRPVGASKTFRQLDAEVQALHAVWGGQTGTAPVVASVPHQHFYGLLFKILWPLCRGAPIASETFALPREVAAWLKERPGVWIASPATLTRLTPDPLWAAVRGHVRAVFSSGGPLPLDAARCCATLFGQGVQEIYGSSETGGVGRRCRAAQDRPWQPMPGVTVRADADGLLHLRSPWLDGDAERATADRGEVYADGTFMLRGRADRVVKVGEKRISLTAIEARLTASGLVRDARAVLLPEGRVGAAVVLAAAGREMLLREGARRVGELLGAALRSHVIAVARPRRWRFVEALPQTAMGKVTDEALQALFAVRAPLHGGQPEGGGDARA
jgi:acyl-coenzyme A synthetase/AMP-(fatty) acid ligase